MTTRMCVDSGSVGGGSGIDGYKDDNDKEEEVVVMRMEPSRKVMVIYQFLISVAGPWETYCFCGCGMITLAERSRRKERKGPRMKKKG